MSLRIPSNDPSLSPSPHRHMTQFRRQHSTSPCSSSTSPSPASSPLKQRLGKLPQLEAMDTTGFHNTQLSSRQSEQAQQQSSDEPMDSINSDHYMTDSPSSSNSSSNPTLNTSSPSRLQPSATAHRRPLSLSFTNSDSHFSKRLATSFPHSNIPTTTSNTGIFSRPNFESNDAPLPRGLRRSTGLLNLDEASHGSAIARKSSYRSRKSHIKNSSSSSSTCSSYSNSSSHSSSSSIHSDFSRASTPPQVNPFLGRAPNTQFSFNADSTAQGQPLKRPHSFGLFSDNIPQKPHFPKQKWSFGSDSKPKWQFSNDSTWSKWQQSQNEQSTPTSSSPFFRQPFFSPSESTPSPFQQRPQINRRSIQTSTPIHPSHLSSPSPQQPTHKMRKMNSTDSLNHASPSPKFTNTQPFSTHPTHPLAFSFATSPSPTPGPRDENNRSGSGTPSFSRNSSTGRVSPAPSASSSASTSTIDANEVNKPTFALPNKPFKLNASLEADISIGSTVSNPEYHTPENYKFVKPLQTAFMSTGLLSKRNRRKPFNDTHMAPPDTPCKRPTAPPMTPGPSQFGNKSLSENTFNFSPRSLPTNFNGSSNNNNQPGNFTRNRFAMDFGGFSDTLFNEPSTPTKRDPGFGQSTPLYSAMPINIPQPATKQISNASTITPSNYMSTTPTSSNSSSTSINRYSSTPQSSSSRWLDGSPSEHSSPRTPEISMSSDVPQISLSINSSFGKTGVVHAADDENDEMEDADVSEAPKTPAKTPKTQHEIAIPSTIMSMEKMRTDSVSDVILRERYSDVQMIGTGEFSIVYAVSEKTSMEGVEPMRYAVKRTKYPFVGAKDRLRRNEEVEILRNLTFSGRSSNDEEGREYIVNLIDAWELSGHLYIVTEYCENGNLDTFLSERGNVSRLDEWRVWKILVEITLVSVLLFDFVSCY